MDRGAYVLVPGGEQMRSANSLCTRNQQIEKRAFFSATLKRIGEEMGISAMTIAGFLKKSEYPYVLAAVKRNRQIREPRREKPKEPTKAELEIQRFVELVGETP